MSTIPGDAEELVSKARRRIDTRNLLHLAATAVLLAAGYPLCRAAQLEIAGPANLLKMIPAIAVQGVSVGAILFAVQHPRAVTSKLLRGDRRRFLFLIPVVGLLFLLYRPFDAALFSVGAVAIAEYLSLEKKKWISAIAAVLVPSAYFLFGFGLVYEFNDIIATFRFYGSYDFIFLRMDRVLLFGGSVSGLRHWVQAHANPNLFPFMEAVYYGTFVQVGAGIMLVGLTSGISRAFRLVGTILLAYYVTLACFFLWPSHGPYLLCSDHFLTFPKNLNTYVIQQVFLANVRTLWHHSGTLVSGGGYYISFPCMHITQPLIVIWFLRSYRRVVAFLAAYDLVLIPAILLLEWHYAVDIVGGCLVAILAIYLIGDKATKGPSMAQCQTENVMHTTGAM